MHSRLRRRFHSRRVSLSARGQLLNTFAGFGSFLALALLATGLYLIDQQFADPLRSSDAGLILAALLMTTSLALFTALLHSRRKPAWRRSHPSFPAVPSILGMELWSRSAYGLPGLTEGRSSRYVDHAQIRLHR